MRRAAQRRKMALRWTISTQAVETRQLGSLAAQESGWQEATVRTLGRRWEAWRRWAHYRWWTAGAWSGSESGGVGLRRWDLGQKERKVTYMNYARGINKCVVEPIASLQWAGGRGLPRFGEKVKRGRMLQRPGVFIAGGERGCGGGPTRRRRQAGGSWSGGNPAWQSDPLSWLASHGRGLFWNWPGSLFNWVAPNPITQMFFVYFKLAQICKLPNQTFLSSKILQALYECRLTHYEQPFFWMQVQIQNRVSIKILGSKLLLNLDFQSGILKGWSTPQGFI
jgi:hypothetical protein